MSQDKTSRPLPAPSLAEASFMGASGHALDLLTDEALFEACGTRIAFTCRHGGVSKPPYASLNLKPEVGDDPALVDENRLRLLDVFGASDLAGSLVVPNQVHGVEVVEMAGDLAAAQAAAAAGADAVLSIVADVPVLLCFADCTPVIVVAPDGEFCVTHAGWRGALGGIAGKALAALCEATGQDPRSCNAYIGPRIGACCYETSAEILAQFVECYGASCDAGGRHLDLGAAVTSDLLACGADPARIVDAGCCTSCMVDTYFSYRAEDGVTGRHGAFALMTRQGA